MRAIYFDMDGTIANLYSNKNWLAHLENEKVYPYAHAKTLVPAGEFSKEINRLQNNGVIIGIISWTSKGGSDSYNLRVRNAKMRWLHRNFPEIKWDEISVVNYGTPKSLCATCENAVLFDDEERNRNEWNGIAYDVNHIMEILRSMN